MAVLGLALAPCAAAAQSAAAPDVVQPDSPEPPGAAAGDPRARFDRAAGALAEGRHRDAAEAFVRLADDAPEHPVAAEALFSAARLYEERLAEPMRALTLYRRLIARHPHSRTALAAGRRAESIERQVGPRAAGGEALTRFAAVLQRFPDRPEAESIADVEALLAEHPTWPGAPRALLWLAQVHRRAGRHQAALDRYLDIPARWPDSDEALHAYRGAGDMAARLDRFDEAAAYYRQMPVGDDPARRHSLDDALAELALQRVRARLYTFCHLVIALMAALLIASLRHAAGSRAAAVRALGRCPTEVWFMLPIALILTGAALTGHESIGPAVAIICAGGLAFTWLSGVGLLAADAHGARLGRLRPVLHAAAVAVAVIALAYIALHRNHLLDMLVETVRFGPDV